MTVSVASLRINVDTADVLRASAALNQLGATANATAGSSRRLQDRQQALVDAIREQAATVGRGVSGLLEYRAQLLGVGNQVAADIEILRRYEQQQQAANDATMGGLNAIQLLKDALAGLAAVFALHKIADYIKDAALLNARYETLGVVMGIVGKNAGVTALQMEHVAEAVAKQGITLNESRESVTRLVQAHIDLANASKLARIAQDAAVIGNINSSEAFQRLVVGIQHGEVEILRNMGIVVNFETAYKQFAATLHKNWQQLSENEKMQARVNAVMSAGADIAGSYEAAMDTAGKQLKSIARYQEDFKTMLGETFNLTLTAAVMAFSDHLKSTNKEMKELSENHELRNWGIDLARIVAAAADNINNLIAAIRILIAALMAEFKTLENAMNLMDKWKGAVMSLHPIDNTKKLIADTQSTQKEILDAFAAVYNGAMAGEDRFSKALEDLIAKRTEHEKAGAAERLKVEQQYWQHVAVIMKAYANNPDLRAKALDELYQKEWMGNPTYKDVKPNNVDQVALKRIEGEKRLQEERNKTAQQALESEIKLGHVTASNAIDQKYALDVQDKLIERKAEIELAGVEHVSDADKAAHQARIKAIDEEIKRLDEGRRQQHALLDQKTEQDYLAGIRAANHAVTDDLDKQIAKQKEANATVGQAVAGQHAVADAIALKARREAEAQAEYLRGQLARPDLDDKERERIKTRLDGLDEEIKKRIALQALIERYREKELGANVFGSMEQAAHEAFIHIGEQGESAFQRIGRTLKTAILDMLYQITIKKWLVQVGVSMGLLPAQLAAASDVPSAALSSAVGPETAGKLSAASSATSLYKTASGGFEGLATGIGSTYDSMMGMFGPSTIGTSGMSSMGATVGAYGAMGAGLLGGHYLGNAIANGYGVGNHGQAINNIGSMIGMALMGGNPVGALIGGVIGGLVNRAFGHQSEKMTANGIRGSLGPDGATGQTYQDYVAKGGWFSSDKHRHEEQAFSDQMTAGLSQAFATLKAQAASAAQALGVSSQSLESFTNTFDLQLTGDAQKDQAMLEEFFGKVGDTIAKMLVPNIAQFQKMGESAAQTLQRLGQDFAATTQAAQNLGKTAEQAFGGKGLETAGSREHLIDLAGGAQNLVALTQGFAQNFLTEAERLAPVTKALDEAMAALGESSITTRAQFKDLVQTLATQTDPAAQKLLVALLQLQEAFNAVHPATPEDAAATLSVADATSALNDAYKNAADAIKNNISALETYKASLVSLKDSLRMGSLSTLTPKEQYAQATGHFEDILARAKGGDKDAQSQLAQAAQDFLQASRVVNASGDTYQRDFQHVQDAIDAALGAANQQQTVDQAQLDALNQQVKGLIDINDSVKSVQQAIHDLAVAMGQQGASVAGDANGRAVDALYQSLLGRAPDEQGMSFWKAALANGSSISDIIAMILASPEYKNAHGSHALGLKSVPFDGYRAVLHKGESVVPAGLQQPNALTGELRAVRALTERLLAEIRLGRADAHEQAGAVVGATLHAADKLTATIEGATTRHVKNTRMENMKVALT